MKKLITLGLVLSAALASVASAHEELTMREMREASYGQPREYAVGSSLGLEQGAFIHSVVIVASTDNSTGVVTVEQDGRVLGERYLTNRLEFVQIQVNAQHHGQRSLVVRTRGVVYVASLGATYSGRFVNPAPTPVPAPGPACELMGYGAYNGYNWNFRVKAGANVLDGSDNLDNALEKMTKLANAGLCVGVVYQACELQGYGAYRGYNWNYRLQLGSSFIDASDNIDNVLGVTSKLRTANICQPNNSQRCSVTPAGAYRGYNWKYRVQIGDRVVNASDNLDNATQAVNQLRNAGFCY